MKTDILAFGAHPDDVELSCAGTLLSQIANGNSVAVVDLTRGELGSRGNAEIREKEAEKAAAILGISARVNLNMTDGFFENNAANQIKVIEVLRKFRPEIVICNAQKDRHPDHVRAANLIDDACFLSGLFKIETVEDGIPQQVWRPRIVLHYIQDTYLQPDIVVDITAYWDKKMESIKAHASQFYDPESREPETYIASKRFLEMIETRAKELGRSSGFNYAEGFTCNRAPGVKDVMQIF